MNIPHDACTSNPTRGITRTRAFTKRARKIAAFRSSTSSGGRAPFERTSRAAPSPSTSRIASARLPTTTTSPSEIPLGEHATNCAFDGSALYVAATRSADIEASQRTGSFWRVDTDTTGLDLIRGQL